MGTYTQQTSFGLARLFSKRRLMLFTGLFVGLVLAGCSSSGGSSSKSGSSNQQNRSPAFQKRVLAEEAAEDARDRNNQIQEQNRIEELELRRMRAERAAQRDAQRAARRAEYEQQQQQQQQQRQQQQDQ